MHVLIVREIGLALRSKEVIIPETNKSKQDWNVVLKRRVQKVLIHFISSAQ